MLVEVGTYIDLTYLNEPKDGVFKSVVEPRPSTRLYAPGTYYKFVKNLSLPPQIIAPAV